MSVYETEQEEPDAMLHEEGAKVPVALLVWKSMLPGGELAEGLVTYTVQVAVPPTAIVFGAQATKVFVFIEVAVTVMVVVAELPWLLSSPL